MGDGGKAPGWLQRRRDDNRGNVGENDASIPENIMNIIKKTVEKRVEKTTKKISKKTVPRTNSNSAPTTLMCCWQPGRLLDWGASGHLSSESSPCRMERLP